MIGKSLKREMNCECETLTLRTERKLKLDCKSVISVKLMKERIFNDALKREQIDSWRIE